MLVIIIVAKKIIKKNLFNDLDEDTEVVVLFGIRRKEIKEIARKFEEGITINRKYKRIITIHPKIVIVTNKEINEEKFIRQGALNRRFSIINSLNF